MFNFGPFKAAKDALRAKWSRKKKQSHRASLEESLPSFQQSEFVTKSYSPYSSKHDNFTTSWAGTQSSRESQRILIYRQPKDVERCHSSTYSSYTFPVVPEDSAVEHNSFVNICNTFWKANLSFSPYKYGDALEDFGSLWQRDAVLDRLLLEAYQATALRKSVLDLCQIALRCGPVRVLKSLLELRIIGLKQTFGNGATMLHEACVAQNFEVVLFLCTAGSDVLATDKNGRTADQVCFCPRIRHLLPQRYKADWGLDPARFLQSLSMHEKEVVFDLAASVTGFYHLQISLQSSAFDVNKEADEHGNYLVHIAADKGLSHIPLLLTLVRLQGADIDKLNTSGLTPLMIAVENSNNTMVDVLLCILGSNPNEINPENGWTALHYAVKNNNLDIISTLTRRGADFNIEDSSGRRPDDLSRVYGGNDCADLIASERCQRIERLSHLAREGELQLCHIRQTDLYTVDDEGFTLIMTTTISNRYENLTLLLQMPKAPINAQHEKSGQAAVTMAAVAGLPGMIHLLMRSHACARIRDMEGLLPLHWAVTLDNLEAAEALLRYPQSLTGLQQAVDLSHSAVMQARMQEALVERQREIVTPELFECSLTGDAGRLFCLLEDGDNVNPISGVGDWPLYLATANGHVEVVQLLHERGGDIRRQHDTTRNTVLHMACIRGYLEIARFLLQQYARDLFLESLQISPGSGTPVDPVVNCVNSQGRTALQLAAERGFSRIVKLLLSNGATTAILDVNGQLYNCTEYEGVQVLIETRRKQHTQDVMSALIDKKALKRLQEIWLPHFDHNLRDMFGDTPLMVACKLGRLEALKFLLLSALYELETNKPCDEVLLCGGCDSDNDSGAVLTEPRMLHVRTYQSGSWATFGRRQNVNVAESHAPSSYLRAYSAAQNYRPKSMGALGYRSSPLPRLVDVDGVGKVEETETRSVPPDLLENISAQDPGDVPVKDNMATLFNDINRASQGSIFVSENKVNHLCAINVRDGRTAFHRAVEGGDFVNVMLALLDVDQSSVNIQDSAGLSPLHLACKLGRKKIVDKLTSLPYVDWNLRTLEGKLPEEMNNSRAINRLVQKAREHQPQMPLFPVLGSSIYSPGPSSMAGSSIDFDALNTRFVLMKQQQKNAAQEKS